MCVCTNEREREVCGVCGGAAVRAVADPASWSSSAVTSSINRGAVLGPSLLPAAAAVGR